MNAVYFNTRGGPEALVYGAATMPGVGEHWLRISHGSRGETVNISYSNLPALNYASSL
jgi:hypothetical protein